MHKTLGGALLCLLALAAMGSAAEAEAEIARADTTWVSTFDEEFINWATPHIQDFSFPDHPELSSQVLLFITIGCPEAPGDCDPWDRLGHLRVIYEDPPGEEVQVEIARFITPYDITGGGALPGTCTWVYDVTDYKSLLTGSVTLRAYIESWIGGQRGWLLSCDFAFVHGVTVLQPYKIINLYTVDWAEYGNPDNPIEERIPPLNVDIPADAEAAKVRVVTTGHGQGNTLNCAEFCPRLHSLVAADETFSHTLWRSDCQYNTCSPQLGTWQYPRAGWCPGDKVIPWDNEVTDLMTPGQPLMLDYNVADYYNECGPHNPDCVSGQTCADCDYNNNGHTQPGYNINAQLILYRSDPTAAFPGDGETIGRGLVLEQNFPNPFNPTTTFYYTMASAGRATVRIYSAGGRLLRKDEREHSAPGTYSYLWNGRDSAGHRLPTGAYFYELSAGGERQARKMILLQ